MDLPGKPTQPSLFELSPLGEELMKDVRARRWYYVSDAKKEQMLVLARGQDEPEYIPHLLQHVMPYLTNSLSEAKRLAKTHKGKVRIYPYSPRWKLMSTRTGKIEGG